MRDARPTVSVVIPCYKYGEYLEQCVESILRQEGVEVRVLIIDDGSPDNTFAVATRLAARDVRVEVRRHEVNRGHIATYNEGLLEWAEGDYSVLISADDMLVEGALARAIAVMQRYPSVGLVYGHAINWVDDSPLPSPRQRVAAIKVWKGHEWIRLLCRLGHNVITSPEVLVRTDLQKEIGGYRAALPHSGDFEMWLRFAARCDIAFIEGADQAYYRIHASNMSVARSYLVDLVQRAAAWDSFFEDSGSLLRDEARLQRSAQRQIAKEALWRACRAFDRRRMAETPIDELKELAYATYPNSRHLPEYWGLKWRESLGPAVTPYLQIFMLSAVHRRLKRIHWLRRWRRKGY